MAHDHTALRGPLRSRTSARMTPQPGLLLTLPRWEERPDPGSECRVQARALNKRTRRHRARPSTSQGLKFPSASNFLTSAPGSYSRPAHGVPGASRAAPPGAAGPRRPSPTPPPVPPPRPLRPAPKPEPGRRAVALTSRAARPLPRKWFPVADPGSDALCNQPASLCLRC